MGLDTIVLAVADTTLRIQLRSLLAETTSVKIIDLEPDAVGPELLRAHVVVTHARELRGRAVVVVVDDHEARCQALRGGAAECVDLDTLDTVTLWRAIEDAWDRGAAEVERGAEVEQLRAEVARLRARIDDGIRLRQLADALPAYLSYLDAEQRYVFLNRRYGEHFSRPPSDMVGRTVAEVVGPDQYALIQPRLAAALAGAEVHYEHQIDLPSGEVRHFEVVYVPDRRANGSILGCFVLGVDVTDRRRAESLTQRVLDNLFCHVWILELDGTVLAANRARPTELTLERGPGRKLWDAGWWSTAPAARDRLREACERAANGETDRYDTDAWVDGSERGHGWRTLDLQVAPLGDADGGITHLIASAVDVTDRVEVEQALRESEERSRLAQRAGGVGVWEFDPSSGVTFWSDTMWDLYGHSPQPGLDPRRVFEASLHPADVDRVRERAALGLRDGEDVTEVYRILRADRSVRWIEATATRQTMPDGRPRVVGVNIDITERRQAEEVLRDSERRLRLAQDASKLGIHDVELETGVIRWDQRVRALWGLDPDEPVTQAKFAAGVHPDDSSAVAAAIAAALDPRSDGRYTIEHRVISRADQQIRWVSVMGRTRFQDSVPIQMVGTMVDITARKRAEDALQRNEEQLRESDRRKDEFLAMLGHELRNPLAAIRSATELLDLVIGDDARLGRVRDVLDRQSNHMVRLIDGLLEVSRIARGKINLEWGEVDLCAVLEAVLADRRAQLGRTGLTLHLELPARPLWVRGDEVRLAQIFDNLISNAVKFTADPGEVHVVARGEGATAVVEVEDTGVGIPPEMLEPIFEAFQQNPQQLARSAGGLGIGLALVRGLVELHGGSVTARSEGVGFGATFEVRLPLGITSSA